MRGQCTSCYAKENVGVDILIKMMNELGKNCGFEEFFYFEKKRLYWRKEHVYGGRLFRVTLEDRYWKNEDVFDKVKPPVTLEVCGLVIPGWNVRYVETNQSGLIPGIVQYKPGTPIYPGCVGGY